MKSILSAASALLLPLTVLAGAPLWTLIPTTPTTLAVGPEEVRTIQYRITNQSRKPHRLEMKSIQGITQVTEGTGLCGRVFALQHKESCLFTLEVNGGKVTGQVSGGPVVCSQGNPHQCYQPHAADALNITRRP